MKTLIFLATFAAANAAADPCIDRLVPYSTPIADPEYRLTVTASTGQLTYIGARHSSAPADPQFSDIENQWNAQRPHIAFYEGPNRPVPKDKNEAIQQTGESGFVRWLAARDGVPLGRLEPEPKDEANYLLQHFTPEQVGLFFILRELRACVNDGIWAKRRLHAASSSYWSVLLAWDSAPFPFVLRPTWPRRTAATG